MKATRIAFLALCCAATVLGRQRFVNGGNAGAQDGLSWGSAFRSPDQALTGAVADDSVFVAKGIYRPGAGSRSGSFVIPSSVAVFGGFSGTEQPVDNGAIAGRDLTRNETILSGDLSGNDLGQTNIGDNSFHVVKLAGRISAQTILDGFTVTGGFAGDPSPPDNWGGGVLITCSEGDTVVPQLRNLRIAGNFGKDGAGLAIRCAWSYSSVVLMRSQLLAPTFTNVVFEANVACSSVVTTGAAVQVNMNYGVARPVFANCRFVNNRAENTYGTSYGGAVYHWANFAGTADPTYVNCLFVGNSVNGYGGAVYNRAGQSDTNGFCRPRFINDTWGNNSTYGQRNAMRSQSRGGGACIAEVTNCIAWEDPSRFGALVTNDSAGTRISHSLVLGCGGSGASWTASTGTDLGWNIDRNPLFLNAATGSFALQTGSPCLDVGVADTSGLGLPAVDLAGKPRIVGGIVDMGAFEGIAPEAVRMSASASRPAALSGRMVGRTVRIFLAGITGNRMAVRVLNATGQTVFVTEQGMDGDPRAPQTVNMPEMPSGRYLCVVMADGMTACAFPIAFTR